MRSLLLTIILAFASVVGAAQTPPPTPSPVLPGMSIFIGLGAEYNRYSSPRVLAGTIDFGLCGGSLCSISTFEIQPSIATFRTGFGYKLKKQGNLTLILLSDAGVTTGAVTSPTTISLGNVGGGFKVRYDLGGLNKSLAGLGISGGLRVAAVSSVSIQPEFLTSVSYRFK